MKKRVTIKDVAAAAGVSRQTVSRAINNQGEISPDTKKRVLQAIEELGYRPNRLAQGMVTQRTKTVALLVTDIANPFFPEVARGVQDTARKNDYNVFLCNTDDNAEEEQKIYTSLLSQGVDGIIILGSLLSDEEISKFADGYQPIIMTNRFVDHPHINLLIVDNILGGALAAEHFIKQNHKNVGIVTNERFAFSQIRRVQGFRDVLTKHGIPHDDSIMETGAPIIAGGYEATKTLLTRKPNITGIFTYNDLMAIGALRACRDMGLRVPEDISIIGFDDIHIASMVTPSLSSVHVDKYEIGTKAMNRVLEMLDNPDTVFPHQNISVELVLRESTRN